jgi:hypothetical protein
MAAHRLLASLFSRTTSLVRPAVAAPSASVLSTAAMGGLRQWSTLSAVCTPVPTTALNVQATREMKVRASVKRLCDSCQVRQRVTF